MEDGKLIFFEKLSSGEDVSYVQKMGNRPSLPNAEFTKLCLRQGFQAISPPIFGNKQEIHTVDLSLENSISFTIRSTKSNYPILHRFPAEIQTNPQTGNTIIIYKHDTEYVVLELECKEEKGDIMVYCIRGNYRLDRAYYNHPNFPKFRKTLHSEYNRLKNVYLSEVFLTMDGSP